VAAIAPQIDRHVLLELLAELGGEPRHVHDRFRVVAIDVEDRRLDAARAVGRVGRRARIRRAGSEADLVVDDQVDRAAGAKAAQLGHLQALVHDALAGERRIAVQQESHDARALGVAFLGLLGADFAEHDRIDRLQVRGIGGQAEMHAAAVRQLAVGRSPKVIFDVARAENVVGNRAALELGEDRRVRLAHHVGQHVQATAVGHADDDLVDADLDGLADDRLERRHRALAAVQTEALGAGVLDVQEALEALRLDQLLEQLALLLGARSPQVVRALHACLDPGLLVGVLDVHELDADPGAVGLAQDFQDAPERGLLQAEHVVEEELAIEVGLGKAVALGVEFRMMLAAREAERIQIGEQVAAHPIGADQHDHPQVIDDQSAGALAAEVDHLGARGRQRFAPAFLAARLQRRLAAFEQGAGLGAELVEIRPPARVDGGRVLEIAGVEVLDEGAVAAVQEGGLLEFASLGHRFRAPVRQPAAGEASSHRPR
jgi:hypothetical protein